jgi:hypothetical protein
MRRHKRLLTLLAAACAICAVYFLGTFVSGSKGKQMIPGLKQELSAVAVPSNDRVVKDYSIYKATHAVAGRTLTSERNWTDLTRFYAAEMQRLGWHHTSSDSLREWGKDVGSRVEIFKKGPYRAELYYRGSSAGSDWTYSLDISRAVSFFSN